MYGWDHLYGGIAICEKIFDCHWAMTDFSLEITAIRMFVRPAKESHLLICLCTMLILQVERVKTQSMLCSRAFV